MKTRIDAIIELTKLGWTAEEIKAVFDTPTEERIIIQPMPYPIYQPVIVEKPARRWYEYWPYDWGTSTTIGYGTGNTACQINAVTYRDDNGPVVDMVSG